MTRGWSYGDEWLEERGIAWTKDHTHSTSIPVIINAPNLTELPYAATNLKERDLK